LMPTQFPLLRAAAAWKRAWPAEAGGGGGGGVEGAMLIGGCWFDQFYGFGGWRKCRKKKSSSAERDRVYEGTARPVTISCNRMLCIRLCGGQLFFFFLKCIVADLCVAV
jgi:hypothetical protein